MYRDTATLITVVNSKDAAGFPSETETCYEVYVNKKSVARSEFYKSFAAGITATAIFEMRLVDFEVANIDGEEATRIEHNGKKYKIIRTYTKDNEFLELTCSDLGA